MLGTLPLRAAYLQQLLHICQALQLQPSAYSTRSQPEAQSLTHRTYSNSSIERINSALTAQLSNTNSGYGPITTTVAAARAAACPRQLLPAGAAYVPQLKEAGRQLSETLQYFRMCQALERSPRGITNELPWGRLPPGMTQPLPLQVGHFGEVTHPAADKTAAAEAAVTPRSASRDLQRCASNTAALQQGLIQEQGRADHSKQGQGRSAHELWAGQGQGQGQAQVPSASAPLDAAQMEAVNALQSLARQLQATGMLCQDWLHF